MGNFAVSASDELIARGKDLIEKLTQPGEKQSDALARMFNIVEEQETGETMRRGGVDVQALDASLANIRTMFLSSVTGKEQIVAEKDGKIAEIKALKDKMERDLREKLDAVNAEKKAASEQAEASVKAAEQAIKDAQAAKEQADTANSLVVEKDRTIATLADKLSAAEAKITGYDDLVERESAAQEQIRELHRTMEASKADYERKLADADRERAEAEKAAERELKAAKEEAARALTAAEKDHSAAIGALRVEMEHRISDAEKDAALVAANAVAEKEREMAARLLEIEKENAAENATLQARIEILEERIKSLQAAGEGANNR